MKYKLKKDRIIKGKLYAKRGEFVYSVNNYDYGCASDDSELFGYEHQSVSLDEDGKYPFFTVPCKDLEEI